ncbi:CAP domain-containing protein [Pseudalkalibacillus caeni]|uniref:Sporulation protein n=1 Tax=Exobacillus caeni TaxID=2574798 RepID=A0A5R9EZ63_9BACL|nr:CAP domain-containing protein [Pseudalkalibacillus caeni]TLS36121.1 sporulation protein [Pseudalkalibacillus caeni]
MKKKNRILITLAAAGALLAANPANSMAAGNEDTQQADQFKTYVYTKTFNFANPQELQNFNVDQFVQGFLKQYGTQFNWNYQPKQPDQQQPAPEQPAPQPEKPKTEQPAPEKPEQPEQAPEKAEPAPAPAPAPAPEKQPEQTKQPEQQQPAGYKLSEYEQQVVDLTNQERAKNGLPALKVDLELSKVARAKSQDMHDKNYFSHTSPTYGSPFEMMKQFGIEYRSAGENIAMGQRSPEEVVNAWMNSEGHRKNILNSNYTHIGVGYVKDGNYWTQEFIGK